MYPRHRAPPTQGLFDQEHSAQSFPAFSHRDHQTAHINNNTRKLQIIDLSSSIYDTLGILQHPYKIDSKYVLKLLKKCALQFHPDKLRNTPISEAQIQESDSSMKHLSRFLEIFSCDQARQMYDRILASSRYSHTVSPYRKKIIAQEALDQAEHVLAVIRSQEFHAAAREDEQRQDQLNRQRKIQLLEVYTLLPAKIRLWVSKLRLRKWIDTVRTQRLLRRATMQRMARIVLDVLSNSHAFHIITSYREANIPQDSNHSLLDSNSHSSVNQTFIDLQRRRIRRRLVLGDDTQHAKHPENEERYILPSTAIPTIPIRNPFLKRNLKSQGTDACDKPAKYIRHDDSFNILYDRYYRIAAQTTFYEHTQKRRHDFRKGYISKSDQVDWWSNELAEFANQAAKMRLEQRTAARTNHVEEFVDMDLERIHVNSEERIKKFHTRKDRSTFARAFS